MKRYALFPGDIVSQIDGNTHFLSSGQLARLYGVHERNCVVILQDDAFSFSEELLESLIALKPRANGDYTIPGASHKEGPDTLYEHLRQCGWGDEASTAVLEEAFRKETVRDITTKSIQKAIEDCRYLYKREHARMMKRDVFDWDQDKPPRDEKKIYEALKTGDPDEDTDH